MGQASSVQREPSMEEILASIRRIIEEGDSTQPEKADLAPTASTVAKKDASTPAAGEDTRADIAEMEGFRAEFASDPQVEVDNRPAPAGLADVQAAVETGTADRTATRASSLKPVQQGAQLKPPAFETRSAPFASPQRKEPAGEESFDTDDDGRTVAADSKINSADRPAPAPGEGMPAILSEGTGRRVAAAFDELNEAFEASRRRSLHEVAEEMLRPMLQEWLDNNLPTLVEKLVREEIERVARGGAR